MLILEESNSKKKPNNIGRKELVNWEKKPLSPNGRNDGSKAHKMINEPRRNQASLKDPRERSSEPIDSMKARMGYGRPKVMK